MQRQRNPIKPMNHRLAEVPRPEYVAAVRYRDGHRELFYIRFADDLADARELVMAEVNDVQSVVIALRH